MNSNFRICEDCDTSFEPLYPWYRKCRPCFLKIKRSWQPQYTNRSINSIKPTEEPKVERPSFTKCRRCRTQFIAKEIYAQVSTCSNCYKSYTCKECNAEFYATLGDANQCFNKCQRCCKMMQCTKCRCIFYVNEKDENARVSKCQTCHKEFNCKYCSVKFYAHQYNSHAMQDACKKCYSIYEQLHNGTLPEDDVVEGYTIRIKYKIEEGDHDGYCSDGYNERYYKYKEKHKFQYPKFISSDDFDEDGQMISGFKFFEKDDEAVHGCCMMKKIYYLQSAKLIKETR